MAKYVRSRYVHIRQTSRCKIVCCTHVTQGNKIPLSALGTWEKNGLGQLAPASLDFPKKDLTQFIFTHHIATSLYLLLQWQHETISFAYCVSSSVHLAAESHIADTKGISR